MASETDRKRADFRRLHAAGCFAIPNPWDVGSALALQALGFKAVASTSAGLAWSLGRPDGGLQVGQVVDHLAAVAAALTIPLNADFENGFADDPVAVAANVERAAATGVAGLSIEDATGDAANPLYAFDLAVERIAAARAALDGAAEGVVLTARSEGFIRGRPDLAETIRRLTAYAEAGADCLFAPGLTNEADIVAVAQAVAPKPLNVIAYGPSLAEMEAMGVRRVSVGGGLARVAWGPFLAAAGRMAREGIFNFSGGAGGRDLNALFANRP